MAWYSDWVVRNTNDNREIPAYLSAGQLERKGQLNPGLAIQMANWANAKEAALVSRARRRLVKWRTGLMRNQPEMADIILWLAMGDTGSQKIADAYFEAKGIRHPNADYHEARKKG